MAFADAAHSPVPAEVYSSRGTLADSGDRATPLIVVSTTNADSRGFESDVNCVARDIGLAREYDELNRESDVRIIDAEVDEQKNF